MIIFAPAPARLYNPFTELQQAAALPMDISVMLTPCFGDVDPPHRKWFNEQIA